MQDSVARRRRRKTKIVATLGPASSTREQIAALHEAGVDVFRLNFSHGTHEDHAARVAAIRSIEEESGRPIAILADLQGPKLRVGTFAEGSVSLQAGQPFLLDSDPTPGDVTRVQLPHQELIDAITPGSDVLLDDGRVRLRVTAQHKDALDTVVVTGAQLSNRKGVNVPGIVLPLSALTAKDRRDLAVALEFGVDWVALSFVQRPDDVAEARRLIEGRAAVLVKLEKPQALDHLQDLIELADGMMVARGDLGVEMPAEDVPVLQRRIIAAVRRAGKPVIVATQMLESMITAPTPTRAEASDVATAVYEGTDAVMLSAETASGQYPIEAVGIMDRIAARVENDAAYRSIMDADHPAPEKTAADAITAAATEIADTIGAAAIATYTTSGSTTLRCVRERPSVPILCLTSKLATARRLVLSYGVEPIRTAEIDSFAAMVQDACRWAIARGYAKTGERLVITAGVPFGTPGNTNILRIAWVGDR